MKEKSPVRLAQNPENRQSPYSRRGWYIGLAASVAALALCACSHGTAASEKVKSVDELLTDLSKGSDDAVRASAASQLARSKDARGVDAAIQALESPSVQVRIAAANGLGDARAAKAADPLWVALSDPAQAKSFKLPGARALANLKDVRAVQPLLDNMGDSPADAVASLTELGKPAVPLVVKALGKPALKDNASKVLAAVGAPAIEPLAAVVKNKDEAPSARLAAVSLLAEFPVPVARAAVAEATRESGAEMTAAAYRYLIRTGQAGTEAKLIASLQTLGTPAMAEDFASSGNAALRKAAEDWARTKVYRLGAPRTAEGLVPIDWGGSSEQSVTRLGLYHFDGALTNTAGAAPVEAQGVSLIPGKWGTAASVGKGGVLKYPFKDNLDMKEGTIEMWISPKVDGTDPAFVGKNNALLMYQAKEGLFTISAAASGGFYAGTHLGNQLRSAGGGNTKPWRQGSWHHVAFTYSAQRARLRFYIDGTMTAESKGGLFPLTPSAPGFSVGCDAWGVWSAFNVDEMQISTGEKNADSIRASFLSDRASADK